MEYFKAYLYKFWGEITVKEFVLNKMALLKFGEYDTFSLSEIEDMFVYEFMWWARTKEE